MAYQLLIPAALTAGSMLAGAARRWLSKGPKTERVPTVTPEAARAMNWAMQRGQAQYSNPFAGFEPIKQNAINVFKETGLPAAQAAWQVPGSSSALSSGSFGSQLGAAYRGLGNDLAAMQAQYGLQNQQQGMNLMNMGLRPQFENVMYPASDTPLSGAFGGLSQSLGNLGMSGMSSWLQDYMNPATTVKGETTGGSTPISAAATERALRNPAYNALSARNYGRFAQQEMAMPELSPNNYGNQNMMPQTPRGGNLTSGYESYVSPSLEAPNSYKPNYMYPGTPEWIRSRIKGQYGIYGN